MDRRKALKLFGALFVCLAGRPVLGAENIVDDIKLKFTYPMNYTFSEEGMGNIIIQCKDGSKIVVPFSDIVDALRT